MTRTEPHSVSNILLSLQKSVDALTALVHGSRGKGQQDSSLGRARQPSATPASVGHTSDSRLPGSSSTAGTGQHQWAMSQFPWPCSPLAFPGYPMCGPGHSLESVYTKMGGITPSLPGKFHKWQQHPRRQPTGFPQTVSPRLKLSRPSYGETLSCRGLHPQQNSDREGNYQ